MHSNWRDLVSQHTLLLHSSCTLRCSHCKLWKTHPLPEDTFVPSHIGPMIANGTFFDLYPRTRLYNIIGGEPLIGTDIIPLLHLLKSAGIYTRLWTHGMVPVDHWHEIYPWINEVALYLPAPDRIEYRAITGTDGFDRVSGIIKDLRRNRIRVSLNASMTPLMVEWLPYFHDIARDHRIPMTVTYYAHGDFTPSEKDYIHRYNWVSGTIVFKLLKRHKTSCPGVPHAALQSPLEMARLYGKQVSDDIRKMLGL